MSTGDLVRRDEDGDYGLVDRVGDVIHGPRGAVPTIAVEDTLAGELEFVDQAAVYGVSVEGIERELVVAAISLRPGTKLDPQELRRMVERELPRPQHPTVVRVVGQLPMTSGQRIRKRPLREEWLGLDAGDSEVFWLAPGEDAYLPLTSAELETLITALS